MQKRDEDASARVGLTMTLAKRSRRSSESGLATTELAIVFPFLLLAMLLGAQTLLWSHGKDVARASADVAAEAASLLSEAGNERSAAVESARGVLNQTQAISNPDVSVVVTAVSVTVTVTGQSPSVVGSWNISESVTVPLERGGGR